MDDVNIFVENSAIELCLGSEPVRVKALPLEAGVQWTKRVRRAMFEKAVKDRDAQRALVAIVQPQKKKDDQGNETIVEATEEEKFAVFDETLQAGLHDDFLTLRDLVHEYDSSVFSDDKLKNATAAQIVEAFDRIFELVNPTKALQAAMKRLRGEV